MSDETPPSDLKKITLFIRLFRWVFALGLTAFLTAVIGVPILVKQLKDAHASYKEATKEVEHSVSFWAKQNDAIRGRISEDFSNGQSFYTNLVARQSQDITNAVIAVDEVFQARATQRLAEDVVEEALNAFDAFVQARSAGDPHLQKPRSFDPRLDRAENDFADELKQWMELLHKLQRANQPVAGQSTSLLRLGESRLFVMITIKLNYLNDIEVTQSPEKKARLLSEIETLLKEYESCFVNSRGSQSMSFPPENICDLPALCLRLRAASDPASAYVFARLDPKTKELLKNPGPSDLYPDEFRSALAADVQKIINGPSIYDTNRFVTNMMEKDTIDLLLHESETNRDTSCFNCLLLRDAFPKEFLISPEGVTPLLFDAKAYPPEMQSWRKRTYEIRKCRCFLKHLWAKYYYRLGRYSKALTAAQESAANDPDRDSPYMSPHLFYPNDYLRMAILEAELVKDVQGTNRAETVSTIQKIHTLFEDFYSNYPDKKDATGMFVLQDLVEWDVYGTNHGLNPWAEAEKHYGDFTNSYYKTISASERAFFAEIKQDTDCDSLCVKTIYSGYTSNFIQGIESTKYAAIENNVVSNLCQARAFYKPDTTNWIAYVNTAKEKLGSPSANLGVPAGILLRLDEDIKYLKDPKNQRNPWQNFTNHLL